MRLKDYGRNQIKRKEYIKQSGMKIMTRFLNLSD